MEDTNKIVTKAIQATLQMSHGDIKSYWNSLKKFGYSEWLFGHFIAWSNQKSEVRDHKRVLPLIAMRTTKETELIENAVAHLVKLPMREFALAIKDHRNFPDNCVGGAGNMFEQEIKKYLIRLEGDYPTWEKVVIQDRKSAKYVYKQSHRRPDLIADFAQAVLFDNNPPEGSAFEALKFLRAMSVQEQVDAILNFNLPFQVIAGAVNLKEPKLLETLIGSMTPSQAINRQAQLQKLTHGNWPLENALRMKIETAATDKRVSTGKALNVAKMTGSKQLEKAAEQRLDNLKVEGDWSIVVDISGSMHTAMPIASEISAVIARTAKCDMWAFNSQAFFIGEMTGKTLDQIRKITRQYNATGSTNTDLAFKAMRERDRDPDGVVIVTDGGHNGGSVADELHKNDLKFGRLPAVYIAKIGGYSDGLENDLKSGNIQFDAVPVSEEQYVLANLLSILKPNTYSLVEEIMNTPLLTLSGR